MNATMTHEALRSSPVRSETGASGAVSGAPLTLLRLEGAAALAGATMAYRALGGAWAVFALLFLRLRTSASTAFLATASSTGRASATRI